MGYLPPKPESVSLACELVVEGEHGAARALGGEQHATVWKLQRGFDTKGREPLCRVRR